MDRSRPARPNAAAFARYALEGLVEATALAAASPLDPVLREVVTDLEQLFLAAFRAVLQSARKRARERAVTKADAAFCAHPTTDNLLALCAAIGRAGRPS